ncbi:MAG TPA: DUF6156 family protein [Polyangiaceae bacterium]|nr:DUF6156 family protein [Polyangiaceae bacterium]
MTSSTDGTVCRLFATYSGVRLPLRLVGPLEPDSIAHRNTFMRGYFDAAERLMLCEKVVYGQVELSHRYEYADSGALARAVITTQEDEETTLVFGE